MSNTKPERYTVADGRIVVTVWPSAMSVVHMAPDGSNAAALLGVPSKAERDEVWNLYDCVGDVYATKPSALESSPDGAAEHDIDARMAAIYGSDSDPCDDGVGNDPEACPGCGCMPGDGITTGCFHPDGCGYWREYR